jgi:hypothetical protein
MLNLLQLLLAEIKWSEDLSIGMENTKSLKCPLNQILSLVFILDCLADSA